MIADHITFTLQHGMKMKISGGKPILHFSSSSVYYVSSDMKDTFPVFSSLFLHLLLMIRRRYPGANLSIIVSCELACPLVLCWHTPDFLLGAGQAGKCMCKVASPNLPNHENVNRFFTTRYRIGPDVVNHGQLFVRHSFTQFFMQTPPLPKF
jgi:hypothetical protein